MLTRVLYILPRTWHWLVLAALAFAAALAVHLGALNAIPWISELAVLMLSGLNYGAFALVANRVTRQWNQSARSEFFPVFGQEISEKTYAVSIPEFVFNDGADALLKQHGFVSTRERFKPVGVPAEYLAGDIRKVIASSDLVGAGYVIDEIGKFTAQGPRYRFGEDLFARPTSFLAFGLQTNRHAEGFLSRASRPKRSRIRFRESSLPGGLPQSMAQLAGLSDFARIEMKASHEGYSADLNIIDSKQGVIALSQADSDRWNVGLVIVLRENIPDEADRRQIYCAGVGHGGTSGSSYYLARHWRALNRSMRNSNVCGVIAFTVTPMVTPEGSDGLQDKLEPQDAQTQEILRIELFN